MVFYPVQHSDQQSQGRDKLRVGGDFRYFLIFTPILGEMIQIDLRILFRWVEKNHQVERYQSFITY